MHDLKYFFKNWLCKYFIRKELFEFLKSSCIREQLSSSHLQIFTFSVFWDSQVAPCVRTAVPFRRCGTVTNTPVRFTTGRRDLGGLAPKTPLPHPSIPPWVSVPAATVKGPAPWECRLAKSSVFGSTWDRCHPRSKLLFACFVPFESVEPGSGSGSGSGVWCLVPVHMRAGCFLPDETQQQQQIYLVLVVFSLPFLFSSVYITPESTHAMLRWNENDSLLRLQRGDRNWLALSSRSQSCAIEIQE